MNQETGETFGPWNPGISSTLPAELLPYVTLLDPENVFESIEEVDELSAFTGLPREQLVTFRPQRLMVHELLVRVCADYAVSDGTQYEDLGNNFRQMAKTILDKHLAGCLPKVERVYANSRAEIEKLVEACFADQPTTGPTTQLPSQSWFARFFKSQKHVEKKPSAMEQDQAQVAHWRDSAAASDGLTRKVYRSLAHVVGAVMTVHGRIRGDRELHQRLVVNQLCNDIVSERIADFLAPLIAQGAAQEGFETLPTQPAPVIINVKGASAAGKSTLRPRQQKMTEELGLAWRDFALISPDIFRKFLLEYESLGEHHKYAGMCSGDELQIVDQKLDALMARKARNKQLPHLLIDRFRFDSFATKSSEEGSNLLTRFGSRVFMFYMITPPHATVERAWSRGLQVGRFKAVDDLLDHNMEAFNGMPQLFFTWALNREKDVYYEFLDNSVAMGEQPRTVAYGRNGSLTILDIEKFIDIKRFQNLDVNALNPDAVYNKSISQPDDLLEFMKECFERLDEITLCDFSSGRIYARGDKEGKVELDVEGLFAAIGDQDLAMALKKMIVKQCGKRQAALASPHYIDRSTATTLGNSGQST
ncbi:MAG: zeta toxin family protein [Acidiferrobacterales bacterium]|nr:zeta toxin family protein [Acidiferrobacterales bacterium]